MGDELSHGQAQNGVNFDFQVKFDLEGHGQSPPETIKILTKVFYSFCPNLSILAWTDKQVIDTQTDTRTDRHTHTDAGDDNTRRPKLASGKNCTFKILSRSPRIHYHRYNPLDQLIPSGQVSDVTVVPWGTWRGNHGPTTHHNWWKNHGRNRHGWIRRTHASGSQNPPEIGRKGLTQCGPETPYSIMDLSQHWFRQWLILPDGT